MNEIETTTKFCWLLNIMDKPQQFYPLCNMEENFIFRLIAKPLTSGINKPCVNLHLGLNHALKYVWWDGCI